MTTTSIDSSDPFKADAQFDVSFFSFLERQDARRAVQRRQAESRLDRQNRRQFALLVMAFFMVAFAFSFGGWFASSSFSGTNAGGGEALAAFHMSD